MNIGIEQLIIICPLVFLAGFIDAVAGGGGLISIPAYLFAGLPVHNTIATNKMSSAMGTSLATWKYAKNGYINWKRAVFCVAFAFAGSNIGARVALLIADDMFKIIMLVILPFIAFYVLRGKALDVDRTPYSERKTTIICMAVAFVVGIYDGFYGPGTGTFLLLLLTGLAHIELSAANGITKVINLTTNISALVVFLINGKVLILLGIIAGCFNIAGNYIGSNYFTHGGAKSVKPIMLAVLGIFFVKVLIEVL